MTDLVVLNYNDAPTVKGFINYIKNNHNIDHIVIVDNASIDDSYSQLIELCSTKVHIIRAPENGGYAKGNNCGINYAINKFHSKYIIISNPDVIFDEEIICAMKKELENSGTASVTGKMVCKSSVDLSVAWRLPDYKDCILENLSILRKISRHSLEYELNKTNRNSITVEAIPGSFFMVNAEIFQKIGMFDENTFLYYEENILGYRLKTEGYKQVLLLNHRYIHNHSISINKSVHSESKRLELAYSSRRYYCETYLKINWFQKKVLDLTFKIGRFNLLAAKMVKRLLGSV